MPFIVIVAIALGSRVVILSPADGAVRLFVVYGLSGYAMYAYRKAQGQNPVSVIATSTDEPDEEGLHR